MLTALAIRDVVLIDRLDLSLGAGLTVLTGETGAGKSILMDSLSLALGARADAALVRPGADQASVMACFVPQPGHPVMELLAEQGVPADDEIVLRRILGRDGRSKAFVNDQPVSVTLLRRVGALMGEIQGQHEQVGLADQASHIRLLDAFGGAEPHLSATRAAWQEWREAVSALEAARYASAEAARDEEWLRHAVDELASLAPRAGEEEHLAADRRRLQQDERRAEAIGLALAELAPRDRRGPGPMAALRAATRALQRLATLTPPEADDTASPALIALERAEEALGEAETLLTRLSAEAEAEADPKRLERAEERLFALRAAARKHALAVADLPALLENLSTKLAALESGGADVVARERRAEEARNRYVEVAAALSAVRQKAAVRLDDAVRRELAPLRLAKVRFHAEVSPLPQEEWGPHGTEVVGFLIATNPGQEPAVLGRVASGGELSRLMLALRVVLTVSSPIPTLVLDEVDSGIGGATAAAVGERLARLAHRIQVLVVTHSPQVAARGAAHIRVLKESAYGGTATRVEKLDARTRREEIARMLAGERITQAARAAADALLA